MGLDLAKLLFVMTTGMQMDFSDYIETEWKEQTSFLFFKVKQKNLSPINGRIC